jgi:hypothetical protein
MAISKLELQNLIYKKKSIGTEIVSDLRQPSPAEKTSINNIVEELMGYILTKHS